MDKFTKEFKNDIIDNQPGYIAIDTGYYHTNYYGCWHKVRVTKIIDTLEHNVLLYELNVDTELYIIGEYPDNYIS